MKGIRIRPEQDGLRASLFDLEADVMEIVWAAEDPWVAVSDVHTILQDEREIAYTTVMTTMVRLHEKGLLARQRDGRRYLYQAKMSRPLFIETLTRDVLSSLPPVGHDAAMAYLVERIDEADAHALDRLEALIHMKRKQRDA